MSAVAFALLMLTTGAGAAASAQEPDPQTSGHEAPQLPQEPAPAAAAPAGTVVQETVIDRQVKELAGQLRCVVCQGLSIQDSPSPLAQEMRAIVRERLAAGSTPAEVKQYFVDSYGEWVLLEPEPRGFNLLVYLLPITMLLGGAIFVYVQARKWTRSRPVEAESVPAGDEAHTGA